MNIIREQRETIIKDNNTAQDKLLAILENSPKSLEVLEVTEELHGDLNFEILKDFEMGNLKTISFNKGEITSIIGLPRGLVKLECPNNMLSFLENLPTTLIQINIPGNYLEKIDIGSLNVLEILNISNNKLTVLEKLPESLKELDLNNNQLGSLDLKNIQNLKKLNISNNPITIIENLPEGIIDFKMDNTPSIEFRNSALDSATEPETEKQKKTETEEREKQKQNYKEAIFEFFRLKQQYEGTLKRMKRDTYKRAPTKKMGRLAILSIKPPCINCKRAVGSLFSNKDNKYTILCGDKDKPCELNVVIFNGNFKEIYELIELFSEETETAKEGIIKQKLDTVFNYVTEEKSVEMFKKELELFNESNIIYKEYLDKYIENFHDQNKKELIQKKNNAIFELNERVKSLLDEYNKMENRELLIEAVRIQINEIYPEIRNRQMLENEIIEVDKRDKEMGIFKYPISLSKLYSNLGEHPRVIKYSINTNIQDMDEGNKNDDEIKYYEDDYEDYL
uniref:Leucine-rich repeat domain-containing protein n=1 Tax=viral metagenome TaxID=1070528 RepID=A0A6C0HTX5_9ZZZZ